jgi:phosphoribosylglycinamide formyltransferase-1
MRIGVLASHEGTTLQAIIDACAAGEIDGQVAFVISNNAEAGALRRARAAGIACAHLSGKTHPIPEALDHAIVATMSDAGVDLVFLAGYMKKLGPRTLGRWSGRIVNTHPALLPKFGGQGMYGMNVHKAVLAAGEPISGATVHLVEAEYDQGPIIAQATVPVLSNDTAETLANRVQFCERTLVVYVLRRIAKGELLRAT